MATEKENKLLQKLSIVMKKEDMDRIKIASNNDIIVDLHNLGTKEAMILINNIINLNRDECNIQLIHGYNHGIALKDMFNNRFENKRIQERKQVQYNQGMTVLMCKSAY